MVEKQSVPNSKLFEFMRAELEKRRGEFPKIAKAAGVKVGWLHACMKASYSDVDIGVRKVEATLKALGFEVSVNA